VVDRDLVRRKLAELSEDVTQVSEYRDLTIEGYRTDWKTQRIVDRTLQMAIGSAGMAVIDSSTSGEENRCAQLRDLGGREVAVHSGTPLNPKA